MLEKHKTRSGQTVLIAAMDNQHLANTILLMLGKIRELKGALEAGNTASQFDQALYGLTQVDAATAGAATRIALQNLYPYLAEAYLRGMEDIRKVLVETLGRHAAIASYPSTNLLPDRISTREPFAWEDDFDREHGDF